MYCFASWLAIRAARAGSVERNFTSTSWLLLRGSTVRFPRKRSIAADCEVASSAIGAGWRSGAGRKQRGEPRDGRREAERPVVTFPCGIRRVPQLEIVDRPAGQSAALKDAVLRLVVIGARLPLLHDGLERDHVRGIVLDDQPCPCLVHRGRGERVHDHADQHDEKYGGGGKAPLVEHLDVFHDHRLVGRGVERNEFIRISRQRQVRGGAVALKQAVGWIDAVGH